VHIVSPRWVVGPVVAGRVVCRTSNNLYDALRYVAATVTPSY